MCGIALILAESDEEQRIALLLDDLGVVLRRRGPDSLGLKELCLLQEESNNAAEKITEISKMFLPSDDGIFATASQCNRRLEIEESTAKLKLDHAGDLQKSVSYSADVISAREFEVGKACTFGLSFLGASLHLRGINPAVQPLIDDSGNILVYNGEVFGGIHVDRHKNDGEALLDALKDCEEKIGHHVEDGMASIPDTLSSIKGPWALIYWQAKSRTLWFGRDVFGRRSLLVHWPNKKDPHFILSSVSPFATVNEISDERYQGVDILDACHDWEELSCGIYSLCMESLKENFFGSKQSLVSRIQKHQWTNSMINKLLRWERRPLEHQQHGISESHILRSQPECPSSSTAEKSGDFHPAWKLLTCLKESVMRRTSLTMFKTTKKTPPPLAILFSGGLDSMILASLAHQCLDQQCEIDLLNVSFDGHIAPDRISAREGLKELQKISPSRRWRLVEIDGDLSNFSSETKHVMSLIHPANTFMDLNIGMALWLAARGEGFVDGELCDSSGSSCRYRYKSMAKILLVGAGADEQCAGYGRHRTKYKLGGMTTLEEEMRLDMQRIWVRNMGRDDRCISDHGKEARYPFLDEDVVNALLEIPLRDIADLNLPAGLGDKKILRDLARLLGLEGAAILPKRAIQFGSRIARESNKIHFGSNRAANQASAGGAAINRQL
ncbi:asparagine synthase family protein [Wolffia australiana]